MYFKHNGMSSTKKHSEDSNEIKRCMILLYTQ